MIDILMGLEPCREEKDVILFEELDEINEVLFFITGKYEIGYSINKEDRFKLRFTNACAIGAYYVTFHKRAIFVYITRAYCHGYFIRKNKWTKIIENP